MMESSIRTNKAAQSASEDSFFVQIKPVLRDMVRHMDYLESDPACQNSAQMLWRGWRTIEKGGQMFGYRLVSQMSREVGQTLDFYLSTGRPVSSETITLSRRTRLRVTAILV